METEKRQHKKRQYEKFKSYYVVWKLACKDNYSNFENSLNRTMQYGNYGHKMCRLWI